MAIKTTMIFTRPSTDIPWFEPSDIFKTYHMETFVDTGKKQVGEVTYYRRRTIEDQRIDPHKSIYDQFNKLRVSDNIRFPAFFTINDIDYEIKIKKK